MSDAPDGTPSPTPDSANPYDSSNAPPAEEAAGTKKGSAGPHRGSLLVVFLTVFIDLLGFGMVLPLLPIYARQFAVHESGLVIGLLMSSFSAMQFLFAPLWGRLSDRIGRRPVLMIGLGGSVVFYTIFGIATVEQSLVMLFVARIGAGIAGATISTAQAYIADCTTLEGRSKGMALIGAAFGLGFTFGPLFGYLALWSDSNEPGPGPGYAAAGLSLASLVLAYFKLPESLVPGRRTGEHHWFEMKALRDALTMPSVALLLFTLFICVFSFANFESTLSLVIAEREDRSGPFGYDFQEVLLVFAYIGFVLTLVQGGIVRRVAGRLSEAVMASGGAVAEIIGFAMLGMAIDRGSTPLLLVSLAVVVSGFAFMTPSLNSLISRRTDPTKQGGILGIGQSVNSLARILGPVVGIYLLGQQTTAPYWLAGVLMALGGVLVLIAAKAGKDYPGDDAAPQS